MENQTIGSLITTHTFPPVVHPRHAREILAAADPAALVVWTGGYALTTTPHRRLVDELLASLAWSTHGHAFLLNGRYGAGKSHLLVLLHLLASAPDAWEDWLARYPEFRRFRTPLEHRRFLVVHFSLDEYGPGCALEDAVHRELHAAAARHRIPLPAGQPGASRRESWQAYSEACAAAGYPHLLLLIDEVSLFLAGKTPSGREADAAFLQFLAGWTNAAPVWVIGALQRGLADVGPLQTHSWRQVEDRFRRETLAPQHIGAVLRDKIIERTAPAAIRKIVQEEILPHAEAAGLPLRADDLLDAWPLHPAALDLLMEVVEAHLSPHRSAVEVLQRLANGPLRAHAATRLITPLDLLYHVEDDLRCRATLDALWRAAAGLQEAAAQAPDPALADALLHLLCLAHLAGRAPTLAELRGWLFAGAAVPALEALMQALQALRRYGAFLHVARDADPGATLCRLTLHDEEGARAHAAMEECRRECPPDDPRVCEAALRACLDPAWPLAAILDGLRQHIPWRGSERTVEVRLLPTLDEEALVAAREGLCAGHYEAGVIIPWPGRPIAHETWEHATAGMPEEERGAFLLWTPRELRPAERDLWAEYLAWRRAANDPVLAFGPLEARVRARCRERAQELSDAVAQSVRALLLEGHWRAGDGGHGLPAPRESLAATLAEMLADGFERRFPAFATLAPHGVPSRAIARQLLGHCIEADSVRAPLPPVLLEQLHRFVEPLGCLELRDQRAVLRPPAPAILTALLAGTREPLRVEEALALLRRPPLGLPPETARLAVAAALRTGALRALDGFLHPLPDEEVSLARADASVFLAQPPALDDTWRPQVQALAQRWHIADAPWALACSLVARQVRARVQRWQPRVPAWRATLAQWCANTEAPPWAWVHSEAARELLERMADTDAPLSLLAPALAAREDDPLARLELFDAMMRWWEEHGAVLGRLRRLTLDAELTARTEHVRACLATGEEAAAALAELGDELVAMWTAYRERYEGWHAACFGPLPVRALREVFDTPAFQAVRRLERLPFPPPPPAREVLEALARARTAYCPGAFQRFDAEGLCSHCRLPLDTPSPLPAAEAVRDQLDDALGAYAALLREHPWMARVRARLPGAPPALVAQVTAFVAWTPAQGPEPLIAALDDRVLTWLAREQRAAAARELRRLHATLANREMTVREARECFEQWLNPDGQLSPETVLVFRHRAAEVAPEVLGQRDGHQAGGLRTQDPRPEMHGDEAGVAQQAHLVGVPPALGADA